MLPWSSFPMPQRRTLFFAGYLLAALLAGAEIVILWLALNPRVPPDYRAFYIDRTTTCLNRDRAGSIRLGETVSFRYLEGQPERMNHAEGMKVCGWSGPANDGTHSLGETSRLRVKIAGVRGDLVAAFEMAPVLRPTQAAQRVVISANGVPVHEATLTRAAPQEVSFAIPHAVLRGSQLLDIAFDFPDSVRQTPVASNIYDRAIKLVSFRLQAMAQARRAGLGHRPDVRRANTHRPSTTKLSTGMTMHVTRIGTIAGRPSMPVSSTGAP